MEEVWILYYIITFRLQGVSHTLKSKEHRSLHPKIFRTKAFVLVFSYHSSLSSIIKRFYHKLRFVCLIIHHI